MFICLQSGYRHSNLTNYNNSALTGTNQVNNITHEMFAIVF